MLVNRFLEDSASLRPDKVALVCEDREYCYQELEEAANRLANGLLECGLSRQERVVIHADNSAEVVISLFATLKANGVFVVVNPQVKGDKLAYILRDCNARVLIAGVKNLIPVLPELKECSDLHTILGVAADGPRAVRLSELEPMDSRLRSFETLLDASSPTPPPRVSIDLDLAALIYTSGSTGPPKGVALTHLNMVTASTSITTYLENVNEDIILSCLPLAFDYGLYQALMAFHFGGTLILEKAFGYPHRLVEKLQRWKVTGFPLVPTMLAMLLRTRSFENREFPDLRYVTNTAQALPIAHIERLRQLLPHVRIFSMYGLTECKRATYLPPEELDRRPGSVGIAIPNTEVWIEDAKGQRIHQAGETGELVIRGAHVMVGYWNKEEESQRALEPGPYPGERLLRTGDLFKMDEDGFLYFVARKDDLIKSSGERVSPWEVEQALYQKAEVAEAAVIGVPDEILGQAIKAFVVLKEKGAVKTADLIVHCRKHLENFMVPKHIEFVDELPKTSTGKLRKKGLQ